MVSSLKFPSCLGLQCCSRCEPSQMLYYHLHFSFFSVYFLSFAFILSVFATSLPIKHNFPHSNKHDFIKNKHEPKYSQPNALRSVGKTAFLKFSLIPTFKSQPKSRLKNKESTRTKYTFQRQKMQWSNLLYNSSKLTEDGIRTANFKYIIYNTLLNNIIEEHGFSDICTSAPRKTKRDVRDK